MKIAKEQLEQLKQAHGSIYEGVISYTDEDNSLHELEFLYRKPTVADVEAHAKVSQKSPLVANLNLLQSLIVYPEPGPIIERVRDYPAAYGRFVDEAITPFFGGSVTVRSRKL